MANLLTDFVIYAFLGLSLGYLMDIIIPPPTIKENPIKALFWFSIQLLIGILMLYLVIFLNILSERENTPYHAPIQTVFVVLFYLAQSQLYVRAQIIYYAITGRTFLPNEISQSNLSKPSGSSYIQSEPNDNNTNM